MNQVKEEDKGHYCLTKELEGKVARNTEIIYIR